MKTKAQNQVHISKSWVFTYSSHVSFLAVRISVLTSW